MRIQASSITSSSSIPFSSYSSISTHAFVSSNNNLSTSQSNSLSLIDNKTRCEGLDLLVKAAIHVTGEFFSCIPFVQRKVIRRRKRSSRFNSYSGDEFIKKEVEKKTKKERAIELISSPKKRKRVMGLPSKYSDSVLQSWKRKTRLRKSVEIDGSSG
ncbi:hypothetical protein FRX31_029239 [Thalictrum thalictroides]|uniref:Uncharacterized protein n=1 Tax=Thalictrum thalictroides TaxID=46969 RepID=A0A7J6V7S7_THATH|nr:hypothetical protein FRX31_029239 [Thalictrum thalictroides]